MNGDPCQGCVGKDSSSCNDTVDSYEGELVVRYEIPSVNICNFFESSRSL